MVWTVQVKHIVLKRLEHGRDPGQLFQLLRCHSILAVLCKTFVFQDIEDIVIACNEPGVLFGRELHQENRGSGAAFCKITLLTRSGWRPASCKAVGPPAEIPTTIT